MNKQEVFHSIFKKELADFLELRKDTKSKGTSDHDKHYLRLFDGYLCSSHHAVRIVTQEVATGWVSSLEFSDITIANAINTIRCFLKYLQPHGISVYVPPVPKYHDDYVPYIFSDEELNRIFKNADSFTFSKSKRFPYIKAEIPMLLRLLLGCGMRLREAVCLKVADIDFKMGALPALPAPSIRLEIVQANWKETGTVWMTPIPYLSLYLGHESLRETEKYMKFSSEMFPEEMECFADFTKSIFPEVDYEE